MAVQTHLTPSYRLFSILDATPIYCIGAPPLVAVESATVNGRSVSSFSVRPFWDTVGGGVPNLTGNIPRQGSGLSCRLSQPEAGSLTRFTASIIKHLMLHRKGDRTRQLSVGVLSVPLHLLARFYFSCPKAAMIGFEPMIPVRCRMLDPFITLAAGF